MSAPPLNVITQFTHAHSFNVALPITQHELTNQISRWCGVMCPHDARADRTLQVSNFGAWAAES